MESDGLALFGADQLMKLLGIAHGTLVELQDDVVLFESHLPSILFRRDAGHNYANAVFHAKLGPQDRINRGDLHAQRITVCCRHELEGSGAGGLFRSSNVCLDRRFLAAQQTAPQRRDAQRQKESTQNLPFHSSAPVNRPSGERGSRESDRPERQPAARPAVSQTDSAAREKACSRASPTAAARSRKAP